MDGEVEEDKEVDADKLLEALQQEFCIKSHQEKATQSLRKQFSSQALANDDDINKGVHFQEKVFDQYKTSV